MFANVLADVLGITVREAKESIDAVASVRDDETMQALERIAALPETFGPYADANLGGYER